MALSPFKEQEKKLTPDELKAKQQRDKDYKAAMDKIPDKKVTVDPWGDVRPAPQTRRRISSKTAAPVARVAAASAGPN